MHDNEEEFFNFKKHKYITQSTNLLTSGVLNHRLKIILKKKKKKLVKKKYQASFLKVKNAYRFAFIFCSLSSSILVSREGKQVVNRRKKKYM